MAQKKTLTLELVSPTSSEKFIVVWVEVEGPHGSFLIGPDHSPLISMIKKDSIISFQQQDDSRQTKEVPGGILFLSQNYVQALCMPYS